MVYIDTTFSKDSNFFNEMAEQYIKQNADMWVKKVVNDAKNRIAENNGK